MKQTRFEAAGLKCIEVAPEGAEGRDLPLMICMHGRGDWGESYVDIAPVLSSSEYRFVFPTAPLPLPGALFEWFRFDSPNVGPGAATARVIVMALIDELRQKYNLPASRIVLSGFSQGGMMTLEVGLRYPEKLAGLMCLSGFLVANAPFNWMNPPRSAASFYDQDKGDLKAVLAKVGPTGLPVLIAHGTYDPVVPLLAGRASRDMLQQAGLPVEYYEFQGAHEITMEELSTIRAFLSRVLK